MKGKKAGKKEGRSIGEVGGRVGGRQAKITSIARPPTKPSFFAEVPRSVGRPQRQQQAAPYHFLHLVGRRLRRHGHRLPQALPCIVANEGQSV